MENYIRKNRKLFSTVIDTIIDSVETTNAEVSKEWKVGVLSPYLNFLEDLLFIKVSADNNKFEDQLKFVSRLSAICDRCKSLGIDEAVPVENRLPLHNTLNKAISDWLDNNLDSELKLEEKKYFTKIAFDKNPVIESNQRLASLKEQAFKSLGV